MLGLPHYRYRVEWSPIDGEYLATCKEVPGLSGLAAEPEDALRQLKEALLGWLAYLAGRTTK